MIKKVLTQDYWLYIVSGHSKVQNWFCKKCGHIAVVTKRDNYWYVIDPRPSKLVIDIFPVIKSKDSQFPLELIKIWDVKYCIKLTINQKNLITITYKWWHLFIPRFMSCVTITRYLLGVKLKGLTPLALVNFLKKSDLKKLREIEKIEFIKEI